MSSFDLLIKGGTLVTVDAVAPGDIAIAGERIVAIGPQLQGDAVEVVDATGAHLFPGFIDAHVHFNEPGREHWEGLETGSRSLAAGGGTLFFEMPLNALPPTLNRDLFERKRVIAEAKSVLDFGLWGGLTPVNLDFMEELADAGVIGFKAFMSRSGTPDFPHSDAKTLKAGMKIAAARSLPVAVHAEDDALTNELAECSSRKGRTGWRDYAASRPIEAELKAIAIVLELAGEIGCDVHIVHVSSFEGIDMITAAKRQGVRVTAETCPHFLLFSADSMERLGALAKCAPPLRDEAHRQELWSRIQSGKIDTLGSDHSPAPPEMKVAEDYFKVWGGISGCQHAYPLALDEWISRFGPAKLPQFSAIGATNVARRFGFDRFKGKLAEGFDADIAMIDLQGSSEIATADLLYRHRISAYVGMRLRAVVKGVWVRGHAVYRDRRFLGAFRGKLLTPKMAGLGGD